MGRQEDDERVGVDLADDGLELGQLALTHGRHEDRPRLARIAAAAVKDGRAAVEPGLDLLGDLLVVLGDDERDGGMVQPVEQLIHDDRRDRQR